MGEKVKKNYKLCERCKHYRDVRWKGVLCGLTNEKPTFHEMCKNFSYSYLAATKAIFWDILWSRFVFFPILCVFALLIVALFIVGVYLIIAAPGIVFELVKNLTDSPHLQQTAAGIVGAIIFYALYRFSGGRGLLGTAIWATIFCLGFALVHFFMWLF